MNKRTTPQRVVERANIVLCSAEGRSGSAICREVGVSRPTVTQWLDRYEAGGVEELLEDRPRSGRPRKITPDDEAEIVRKTLEEKPADATHWSCRLMAKEVGVHPTTISRIWRAHGLQPHRIEYFKLSTDPHFGPPPIQWTRKCLSFSSVPPPPMESEASAAPKAQGSGRQFDSAELG